MQSQRRASTSARKSEPPGDYESVKEAALRLLERRPRTRTDLLRRLGQSGVEGSLAEEVVGRLAEVGLISDGQVAAQVVREELRKGSGDSRIRQKLSQAGVGSEEIQVAIDDLPPEIERALEVGSKRAGRVSGRDRRDARKRLGSFLQSKGFGYETVSQAVTQLLDEVDAEITVA